MCQATWARVAHDEEEAQVILQDIEKESEAQEDSDSGDESTNGTLLQSGFPTA